MDEEPFQRRQVTMWAGGGPKGSGAFTLHDVPSGRMLTLDYEGRTFSATESDFFEALCSIRKELESDGIIPYCYGASRRCFPSGMGRDMGAGLRIYQLELGRPGRLADLVFLLDSAPDLELATVEEQEAFWREWRADLPRSRKV